jgi:hypothetical protein
MIGQKFAMLTVLYRGVRDMDGNLLVLCECDCGTATLLRELDVTRGKVKSCGCLRRSGDPYRRHGYRARIGYRRVYQAWKAMRQRCTNPYYPHYHGRGIKVCERWDSFENFLADMGEPPEGMSLDRKNVDGNYEPGNCRWADKVTQMNNRRDTVRVEVDGRSQTFSQWAAELGVSRETLRQRYYRTGRII